MSFDLVHDGGVRWFLGVLLLAAIWVIPAMLYAIRRQLPPNAPARRALMVVQLFAVLGAAYVSISWLFRRVA